METWPRGGLRSALLFLQNLFIPLPLLHNYYIIIYLSAVCIFTRKIDDCPAYGGFSALETRQTITAEML